MRTGVRAFAPAGLLLAGLLLVGATGPAVASVIAPTSASFTTSVAASPTVAPHCLQTRVLGYSVQKRPIVACRQGTPGGTVALVIGVIHGNETLGGRIVDRLRISKLPKGLDLWTVRSMNPDGVAAGTRANRRGVDLNRNFPYAWVKTSKASCCYSGYRPLSEPESKAIAAFIVGVKPHTMIVLHQPLRVVDYPSKGDASVTLLLAHLTGRPAQHLNGRTGILTGWTNAHPWHPTALTFELGRTESAYQQSRIIRAFLTVFARRIAV